MHVISIYNSKGGVGKTTTAHSLAFGLAADGRRVLLVDLDHQANLSGWCKQPANVPTLDEVTRGEPLSSLVQEVADGVDIVPASDRLLSAESAVGAEMVPQRWLARHFKTLRSDRWDYIIIDCPPSMGALSIAALAACQWVLVPVELNALSLAGVGQAAERIEQIADINEGVQLLGVLPVRQDLRKVVAREVLEQLKDGFGEDEIFSGIRTGVRLEECPSFGISIYEYAAGSPVAEDYKRLVQEVIHRVEA